MKKLTYFHPQVRTRLLKVLVPVSLAGMCLSGTVLAADNTWEIQPGNSLSKIVAEKYPDYGNRQVIMQEILKRNPQAFRSENINNLIVGKTLQLPDPADIPELKPPAPKPAEEGEPALQEKVKALEAQVTELEETITILEEENTALQEMLHEAVSGKPLTATAEPVPAPVDNTLQQRLDEAEKALSESKVANTTLEEQLAAIQRENEVLQNDLQQIRAAAAVAETKAVGSGNLPWILLGLLALLTLPLLWLLRRKREPAAVAVASGLAAESTSTIPADVPPSVVTDSPVTVSIMPSVDENPDAALKLDIARAYLDLRDSEGAADILQDVLTEGGEQQRQEAREILSFIT